MRYAIDAGDRIVALSDDWSEFALRNGAPNLESENVLERRLWEFIDEFALRDLYRMILRRVRTGIPLTFDFRCDAPDCRRLLRMHVRPLANRGASFETETVRIETRDHVGLLDVSALRSTAVVRVCSWCKKVHLPPFEWVEVEEAIARLDLLSSHRQPMLTHGICRTCVDDVCERLTA